jgi:hypothetical protein
LVFAKPGTSVVILNRKSYVNGHQYAINQMRCLSVTYIDVFMAFFPSHRASILYYSEEFKEWAKDNHYILPAQLFFKIRMVFSVVVYLLQYIRENPELPIAKVKKIMTPLEFLQHIESLYTVNRGRLKKILSSRFW